MAIVKEYVLSLTIGQAQANITEINASFREQESLIEALKEELSSFEQKLSKTSKTQLAARKSLNKKISETKNKLVEEKDGLKNVTEERKEANKELKTAEENTADYSGVLGIVDGQIGGAISGLTGLKTTIMGATKGFNLMKVAIIGTGIGALLIALVALGQAFKSSEEGQNTWNKIMGVLGAVVDVFTDRIADLGEFLINLFTSPVETLKNFGKAIKEFVMDKVEKVVEGLGFMGEAISKLFKGDFSGAMDSGKKGLKSLNDGLNVAKMATDAVTESTKALIKEIAKEAKVAARIADQRARADKLERAIVIGRAEADRDRAILLEKAVDKEKFTLTERIAFLVEAGRLEDEITKKEIEAATIRLKVKILENAQGKSNKEALEEEVNLKAALIQLETARASKQKEITSQIIGFRNEERANAKADSDAARTRGQARRDERIANEQAVKDFKDSLIIEDKKNQFAAIEKERADRVEELKELKASETEKKKMLLDIETSFNTQKALIEEENEKAIQDFKDSLILKEKDTKFTKIEEERAADLLALEQLKLSETAKQQMILDVENSFKEKKKLIEAEEKVIADEKKAQDLEKLLGEKEITLEEEKKEALKELERLEGTKAQEAEIIAKFDKKQKKLDGLIRGQKLKAAKQVMGGIEELAGKGSAVGKAMAIGQATISGVQGVQNAYTTAQSSPITAGFPAYPVVQAALAGAIAVKNLTAIKSVDTSSGGGGNIPTASGGAAPIPQAPPEFNVVGSSGTNQLADAIGGQSQQPLQAFVVASEVTNAQALERSTIDGATIG